MATWEVPINCQWPSSRPLSFAPEVVGAFAPEGVCARTQLDDLQEDVCEVGQFQVRGCSGPARGVSWDHRTVQAAEQMFRDLSRHIWIVQAGNCRAL